MVDVHTKEIRSYNMSRIRSKNTKPELLVRRKLYELGFRYRLHVKHLPGKPDIVLNKFKVIIQVNGCFWHGHDGCKYFKIPKTNTEWWKNKIQKTKHADLANNKKLEELGWKVITIYECQLSLNNIDFIVNDLKNTILPLGLKMTGNKIS
jgi:DNA mismatch endonuclease (patch repair protein)